MIVLGDKFLPKMDHVKYMVWNCNSREMSMTRSDINYSIKLSVTPGQTVGSYRRVRPNLGPETGTWKFGRRMKGAPMAWLTSSTGEKSQFSITFECARQAGFGL